MIKKLTTKFDHQPEIHRTLQMDCEVEGNSSNHQQFKKKKDEP